MRITNANIKEVFKSKQESKEVLISKGYELIKEVFADNSGFGGDGFSASPSSVILQVEEAVKEHGEVYTAITEVGQFQVYIGIFKKSKASKKERLQAQGLKGRRKIARNTYECLTVDGDRRIILHNTAVVTFTCACTIILNSGGWHTSTTKDRINRVLRENNIDIALIQYQFNWYLCPVSFWNQKENDGLSFGKAVKNYPIFFDGIILDEAGKVIEGVTA